MKKIHIVIASLLFIMLPQFVFAQSKSVKKDLDFVFNFNNMTDSYTHLDYLFIDDGHKHLPIPPELQNLPDNTRAVWGASLSDNINMMFKFTDDKGEYLGDCAINLIRNGNSLEFDPNSAGCGTLPNQPKQYAITFTPISGGSGIGEIDFAQE